ncbi:AI-2E family transporter [Ferruginibacter lapsinanis]|uniref:AI-2E family transporter n=1 Tax=Ferruginibacter lapsinanis TaxID=563172 RepID=UPI001E44493A|nr:AI-2E family transporter [Ferruginibacter lapsinanis]UEG51043.1 AI-2E family transporter [Ferruginibacter lapsinanis]
MLKQISGFPLYAKACFTLLLIALVGWIIFIGAGIIIPFSFSLLIAVLLLPINDFLEKRKVNRVIAILISLLLSVFLLTAIVYFLASQILDFTKDIPGIKIQLQHHVASVQKWLTIHFKVTKVEQVFLVNNAADNIKNSGFIGETVLSATQILPIIVLLPVYTFLLLYYRDMIYSFFIKIFSNDHTDKVKEVLKESRYIVQGYMLGLILEMAIVSAINSAGFLILGIKYAFFLGFLAALLNIIPYIGMLIAAVLCAVITLATSNQITDVIGVMVILTVVQFIDNNIIMPKVVSSKVKINALITILGVIAGGALAGISGMFLSIPSIAILKVIFDRVQGLEPWGYLLGDEITGTKQSRIFRKKKPEMKVV